MTTWIVIASASLLADQIVYYFSLIPRKRNYVLYFCVSLLHGVSMDMGKDIGAS